MQGQLTRFTRLRLVAGLLKTPGQFQQINARLSELLEVWKREIPRSNALRICFRVTSIAKRLFGVLNKLN